MRVFLTGATGFIGSFVARRFLDAGCEVHALVEPAQPLGRIGDLAGRIAVHRADLGDREGVRGAARAARPEACVHLAWYAVPGKYLTADENTELVHASLGLYRAVTDAGCKRFVGAGTCIEYDVGYGLLHEERTPLRPHTLYGASKHALHGMLREVAARDGVSLAWLRYFFLYGPGEAPQRLVADVLGKLLRGEEAETTSGEQVRDFAHVADVAAATVHVTTSPFVGAVNVGTGVPVTVREVLRVLGEITGRPELLRVGALPRRAGDPPFICADVSRLKSLGFSPEHDLMSGLRDTVRAAVARSAG